MSLLAKVVFGIACLGTGAVISYVHLSQYLDRQYLHEGIVKDLERQQKKKTENLYNLQTQVDITKRYKEAVAQREAQEVQTKTRLAPPSEEIIETLLIEDEANEASYIVPTFDIGGHIKMSML